MAVKTINFGINFEDIGNSASKVAENLNQAISSVQLGPELEESAKALISRLEDFSTRAMGEKSPAAAEGLLTEQKLLKKRVDSLIADIRSSVRSLNLDEEIKKQLEAMESEIEAKEESLRQKMSAISSLQRIDESSVKGTGFGGARKVDVLISSIKKYYEEVESLSKKGAERNKDEQKRLDLLTERAPKILALETAIKSQIDQEVKLREEYTAEEAVVNDLIEKKNKLEESNLKGTGTNEDLRESIDKTSRSNKEFAINAQEASQETKEQQEQMRAAGSTIDSFQENIQKATQRLFGFSAIFNLTKRVLRESIRTVKELDKSFAEIAMVTTMTNKEVWKMQGAFTELAKTTGLTVTEIGKLSVAFFRQGRSMSETMKLVEAAGMAAKIAGISGEESVRFLTSAINGFQMSAEQAMVVSDKFAALAASSASSYEELATALSKVAAQAYSAGVNIDNMMGFLAAALETTREAPENIGTAFKTIFARMSEIKDYGATLEDGMDIGRVDTALKSIGVELRNNNGELRNLDEVLIDVGTGWQDLNKNQKAYVATALAGTRQQTRLLAVLENFDRTMELAEISSNSLGASYAQQAKYYQSLEYAITRLQTAWQDLIVSLTSSDVIIFFTNVITGTIENITKLVQTDVGKFFTTTLALTFSLAVGLKFLSGMYAGLTLQASKYNEMVSGQTQATLMSILMDKLKIRTLAGVAAGSKLTAAAMLKLSLATGGVLIAIGAVVAATFALVKWLIEINKNSPSKTLKSLEERTKGFGAEIYNLNKKATDVRKLTSEFEELSKKVNKSEEEVERLSSLTEQISDQLGEDYNIIDISTGLVDMNLVNEALQEIEDKAEETRQKLVFNAQVMLQTQGFDALDNLSQQYILLDKAIKASGATTEAEFKNMSKSAQQYYQYLAKAELSNLETKESYQRDGNYGPLRRIVELVPVLAEEDFKEVTDRVGEEMFQTWNEASAKRQAEILDELSQGLSEAQTEVLKRLLPGSDTIQRLREIFGAQADVVLASITNLYVYDELSDLLKDLNLEGETLNNTIANIITKGPIQAFNALASSAAGTTLSFEELRRVAIRLNDEAFKEIDTTAITTSLKGMGKNLEEVQTMLESGIDLGRVKELVQIYPELASQIANNIDLQQDGINKVMEAQKQAAIAELELENEGYENSIRILQAELNIYKEMLEDETYLKQLQQQEFVELQQQGLNAMYADYKLFAEKGTEYAIRQKEIEIRATQLMTIAQQNGQELAMESALSLARTQFGQIQGLALQTSQEIEDAIQISPRSAVEGLVKNLEAEIDKYRAFININKATIEQINNGTFWKQAEASAKEYKAQLDLIYILTQKLTFIDQKLAQYRRERDAVGVSGENYIKAIRAENAALEEKSKVLKELTAAQEQQQSALESQLGALRSNVEIINGRMIPNLKAYNKLTPEQKEIIDGVVVSYNDLNGAIFENSEQIAANTKLIAENNRIIRDRTIELYETIRSAIENFEKKKLEIIKKGIAEERKLLDERRKLYEEAFSEEDYQNELEDVNTERSNIIKQLAALEGATDLTSLRKRQDLLQKKAELDERYNLLVRDYNREALFSMLDAEAEYLDQREEAAENYYEQYISDTERMEAEINRIMQSGAENILEFLKANSDEYANSLSLVREDMENEWMNMIDQVLTSFDDVDSHIPDLSPFLNQIGNISQGISDLRNKLESLPKTIPITITTVTDDIVNDTIITEPIVPKAAGNSSSFVTPVMTQYATGGLATETGPAWLDGTPSKPERVLSPIQTELFERMVSALEGSGTTTNLSESISIGNITISTPQLNTNADFASAGRSLATELQKAISERGLNINKKR